MKSPTSDSFVMYSLAYEATEGVRLGNESDFSYGTHGLVGDDDWRIASDQLLRNGGDLETLKYNVHDAGAAAVDAAWRDS